MRRAYAMLNCADAKPAASSAKAQRSGSLGDARRPGSPAQPLRRVELEAGRVRNTTRTHIIDGDRPVLGPPLLPRLPVSVVFRLRLFERHAAMKRTADLMRRRPGPRLTNNTCLVVSVRDRSWRIRRGISGDPSTRAATAPAHDPSRARAITSLRSQGSHAQPRQLDAASVSRSDPCSTRRASRSLHEPRRTGRGTDRTSSALRACRRQVRSP